jgi:hypothetical protein
MKQTPDIEQRLEKTLNSFDGIQRATPGPYFFTRLKARLTRQENEWSGIAGFISRPAYAFTMICLVLLMNTWIVVRENEDASLVNTLQTTTEQLPDEYNVAVNSFYEYETPSYE